MTEAKETDEELVIPKRCFESAVKQLTSDILAREKFNYERFQHLIS